jgi:hypothetical protein
MTETVNHAEEVARQQKISDEVAQQKADEAAQKTAKAVQQSPDEVPHVRLADGFDAPVSIEVAGVHSLTLVPGETYPVTAEQLSLFIPLDAVEAV